MNIRNKKVWLFLAVLVTVAAAVAWLASVRETSQFVTLSDGVTYRFVGVTWGTTHDNLTDDRLVARLINYLPPRLKEYVRKKFRARLNLRGTSGTGVPSLCIWLKPVSTNATAASSAAGGTMSFRRFSLQSLAMLANGDGVEAGMQSSVPLDPLWSSLGAVFQILPRRSRMLECHFYADAADLSSPSRHHQTIRFANPLYRHFPQWKPEPPPAVKEVGDAEVRLSNWRIGYPSSREAAYSLFDLQIVSTNGTTESWAPQRIELSDATGNHWTGTLIGTSGTIAATFWPDENALRLRVEFKRASGFPAADLITFTNLPLPAPNATNGTTLTNVSHGIPILVRNYISSRAMALNLGSYGRSPLYPVEVELPGAFDDQRADYSDSPPGLAVDPVEITTDTGEKLEFLRNADGNQFRRRILSSIPAGAKSLNVTIAVQKTRTADFYVKPIAPK